MAKINWKAVVPIAQKEAEKYRSRVGQAPNLRGLFYALVSIEILPNTRQAYKGLSRVLSKARKRWEFPWHLLQDTTRVTLNYESMPTTLEDLERWGKAYALDALRSLVSTFHKIQDPDFRWKPFKWEGQPKRVIIACEKEGASKAIASLTGDLKVEVNAMRGYSSTTNMKRMADRITRLNKEGFGVELILVTDYDPSGEDISRFVGEELQYAFGCDVNVNKILLTREQIDNYDLPHTPEDSEEIAKMMRDPRFKNWHEGLFRVELDAMLAIEPEAFQKILVDAISEHFDEEIAEEVVDKTEEIRDDAEERMEDLAERIGDLNEKIEEFRELIIELREEEAK